MVLVFMLQASRRGSEGCMIGFGMQTANLVSTYKLSHRRVSLSLFGVVWGVFRGFLAGKEAEAAEKTSNGGDARSRTEVHGFPSRGR